MKTVLLAAGFGSRLWPLSTSEKPKQFQQLLGKQSLLQYTYELFRNFTANEELYVLTLKGLEHWVYEQLPAISKTNVLIVPERRNTLPHTLLALNKLAKSPEEQVLFSGTDLMVTDRDAFGTSVSGMGKQADARSIVMLLTSSGSIDPNAGYALLSGQNQVKKFYEKPGWQTIEEMSRKGSFHKNTFTYVVSPSALEPSLNSMDKDIASHSRALLAADGTEREKTFLAMPFCDISTVAFQQAPNIVGQLTASDFIDLGTFNALYRVNDKKDHGNVVFGKVILENCTNNFVVNQMDEPLVVLDAHDSVIVQTPNGSLVSPLDQADRIGAIYKEKIHA